MLNIREKKKGTKRAPAFVIYCLWSHGKSEHELYFDFVIKQIILAV